MSSARVQIRFIGTPIALSDGINILAEAQKVPFMVQPRQELGRSLLQQTLGDELNAIRERHSFGPWADISTQSCAIATGASPARARPPV
jgi:hypothetical protein